MSEEFCAFCESFCGRGIKCLKGNTTIVPYNVSCDKFKLKKQRGNNED